MTASSACALYAPVAARSGGARRSKKIEPTLAHVDAAGNMQRALRGFSGDQHGFGTRVQDAGGPLEIEHS